MFNDFFFWGGRVVKSVSQFVLLQWQPWYKYSNTYAAQQSPRKLRGLPHGYYWRVFICLLRLSQSGLSWGLCFPLGQLCVSCRSGGAALLHRTFLPPPPAVQRVGFARGCSSHGDAETWETSQGLESETDTPSLAKFKVKGPGEILDLRWAYGRVWTQRKGETWSH